MGFDSRPQALRMLTVLAIDGIIHKIRVGQDLRLLDIDLAALAISIFLVFDIFGLVRKLTLGRHSGVPCCIAVPTRKR